MGYTVLEAMDSSVQGMEAAMAVLVKRMDCDGGITLRYDDRTVVMRCAPTVFCLVQDRLGAPTPKLGVTPLIPWDRE